MRKILIGIVVLSVIGCTQGEKEKEEKDSSSEFVNKEVVSDGYSDSQIISLDGYSDSQIISLKMFGSYNGEKIIFQTEGNILSKKMESFSKNGENVTLEVKIVTESKDTIIEVLEL